MRSITIVDAGLLTTVQDLGRFGYTHIGVSPCGAADSVSLRAGNRLSGNRDSAPALEMTLTGAKLILEDDCVFAITGADCEARLNGTRVPLWRPVTAPGGGELTLEAARRGARCYLCVHGGIEVPSILGSGSTDLRAGFGGFAGRALRKGDRLCIGQPSGNALLSVDASALRYMVRGGGLRAVRGPQVDRFTPDELSRFLSSVYTVRDESNRLGIRLSGDAVPPANPNQLLTEGASAGAIQITPDGQPIILFVDQQTTGGYLKIANVIAADLPRVGQLQPRSEVRFIEVNLAVAHAAAAEQERQLRSVLQGGV